MTKADIELRKQQLYKDRFNELFDVGQKIKYMTVKNSTNHIVEMTIKQPAYMSYGQAVVFFEEKPYCFSVEPDFLVFAYEQRQFFNTK